MTATVHPVSALSERVRAMTTGSVGEGIIRTGGGRGGIPARRGVGRRHQRAATQFVPPVFTQPPHLARLDERVITRYARRAVPLRRRRVAVLGAIGGLSFPAEEVQEAAEGGRKW